MLFNTWHQRMLELEEMLGITQVKSPLYSWGHMDQRGWGAFPRPHSWVCSQLCLLTPSLTCFLLHQDNMDFRYRYKWSARREQQNQGRDCTWPEGWAESCGVSLKKGRCKVRTLTRWNVVTLASTGTESLSWWNISRVGMGQAASLAERGERSRAQRQASGCPEVEDHFGWWANQKHVCRNSGNWAF